MGGERQRAQPTSGALDSAVMTEYVRFVETRSVTVPAVKRAKTDPLESVRVRSILLRFKDCKHPLNPNTNQQVTRTRVEAEALLRNLLDELRKDGDHSGDSMWALKSTSNILRICRMHSECSSAMKGGSNCGDLGWLG